jgi:hypothetical protein
MNLIPGAGLTFFFINFRYAHCPRPILVVSSLRPGENNLTTGCHRDSKSANFSPPVCSPTEKAGKNLQTVFSGWSAACHRLFTEIYSLPLSQYWGAKDKISFYIVNVNFTKIVAFKGTIRIFLNVVTVHIQSIRHPTPYIIIWHTFFLSVSL